MGSAMRTTGAAAFALMFGIGTSWGQTTFSKTPGSNSGLTPTPSAGSTTRGRGVNDRTPGSLRSDLDAPGSLRHGTATAPTDTMPPGLNQTKPGAQQPVTPLGAGTNATPGTRPVNP